MILIFPIAPSSIYHKCVLHFLCATLFQISAIPWTTILKSYLTRATCVIWWIFTYTHCFNFRWNLISTKSDAAAMSSDASCMFWRWKQYTEVRRLMFRFYSVKTVNLSIMSNQIVDKRYADCGMLHFTKTFV